MNDLYNTLGVKKDASQAEIKTAFRNLARKHHPDKPGGDEEKFKEVQQAYEVLSDSDKRHQYDTQGLTDDLRLDFDNVDFYQVFETLFASEKPGKRDFTWVNLKTPAEPQPGAQQPVKVRVPRDKIVPGQKLAIRNDVNQKVYFKLPENISPGKIIQLANQNSNGDLLVQIIAS